MGQAEIIKLLKKYKELSTTQIMERVEEGKASVNVALKKLTERGEIKKRKKKREIKKWIIENHYKLKCNTT